jgi:hypothetical protein
MRYIQRDNNGNLIGHYANRQPYATEEVPDDHPDIVAWTNERSDAQKSAKAAHKSQEQQIADLQAQVKILMEKLAGNP